MSAVASSSAVFPILGFPAGVDMHWENNVELCRMNQSTRTGSMTVYEIS